MSRAELLRRLEAIRTALPAAELKGDQHLAFSVRKKNFAWFLDDHHGDGRLALNVKAAPGRAGALADEDPDASSSRHISVLEAGSGCASTCPASTGSSLKTFSTPIG